MHSSPQVVGSVVAQDVVYPVHGPVDRVARLVLVDFRQLLSSLAVAMEWEQNAAPSSACKAQGSTELSI